MSERLSVHKVVLLINVYVRRFFYVKKLILISIIQNNLGMYDVPFSPERRRENSWTYVRRYGPANSVGIVTDYRLGGRGSNPGRDEIFRPSRPALGTTKPPAKWVPGISRG